MLALYGYILWENFSVGLYLSILVRLFTSIEASVFFTSATVHIWNILEHRIYFVYLYWGKSFFKL